MSKVKKAANPAIKRDYPPEAGVELRGKEGEPSYAPALAEQEGGNKVNTSKLLEIDGVTRIRVHPKSLKRLKARLKELTGRSIGISMEVRVNKLNQTIQGWVNYYKLADMRAHCQRTDEWLRRRLRMCYWKQWKKIGTRLDNLIRLGFSRSKAWEFANTRKGYWHTANSHILACSLTNDHFRKIGLSCLSDVYSKSLSLRTAVCRTARTVV